MTSARLDGLRLNIHVIKKAQTRTHLDRKRCAAPFGAAHLAGGGGQVVSCRAPGHGPGPLRLIHGDSLVVLKALEDKLASQKQIKNVEAQRNDKRRSLFEGQDAIDQQREELIGTIEGKLQQATNLAHIFTIRWSAT